jgi:uncharacterized protein YjiS (DUF1127 family)
MLCIRCISSIEVNIQRIVGERQYGDTEMATDTSEDRLEPRRIPAIAWAGSVLRGLFKAINARNDKRRGRVTLSELTDGELEDIGVSRADAMKEAAQSAFWR